MLIAARSRPFLLLHRACGGAFSAYSYNNVRQSGWLSQEKSTLGHGIYNRKCENGSSERCILRRKVASASWLNMVERFFRDLTQDRLRRGVFRDLEELILAIGDYIDRHNDNPKPFIWTARASDILEKVKRARRALHKRQSA